MVNQLRPYREAERLSPEALARRSSAGLAVLIPKVDGDPVLSEMARVLKAVRTAAAAGEP